MIRGKGSRQEQLPLPVDVGRALADWLRDGRPRCEHQLVFTRVRAPHSGLSSTGIAGIVHAACKRAGLPEIGPHRLRHTAATEMLRAARAWQTLARCCATAMQTRRRSTRRSTGSRSPR